MHHLTAMAYRELSTALLCTINMQEKIQNGPPICNKILGLKANSTTEHKVIDQ